MLFDQAKFSFTHPRVLGSGFVLGMVVIGACSSSSKKGTSDGGGSGSSSGTTQSACISGDCTSYDAGGCELTTADASTDAGQSTCSSPGEATVGPADTHCATGGPDGGAMTQTVAGSSCCASGDAGGGCAYNATMYGHEGDDDDCKYHVTWTSTPICEGSPGAQFVVTAVYKTRFDSTGAPLPLTGANPETEVFTTSPGDWDAASFCDDNGGALGPPDPNKNHLIEGPPGTYTGNIAFNMPGQWTVRFHFNEECYDVLPDSPHGHAAFHITVP
ncbi:MAG: hypothetical protein ACLP1X_09250 [Polyangiaceae bacterium]|jgi:hypothetical protein